MRSMFATAETRMHQRQRFGHGLGLVACVLILAGAYGLEWIAGMEPCPLCMVQRLVFVGMALVFLVAFLHGSAGWGRFVYAGLTTLIAASGVAVAGRHLWLQSLPPDEVPVCGPGFDYMVDTFGFLETVPMVLAGSGECAEVHTVLGITLPGWTLAAYVLLGLWTLLLTRWPR